MTLPRGELLRYQAVPYGKVGDSSTITVHSSLSEARAALGVVIKVTPVFTTPKSECPHNQPGYRADNKAAKRSN